MLPSTHPPYCCPCAPSPAAAYPLASLHTNLLHRTADLATEVGLLKEGARLVCFLYPSQNKPLVEALAGRRLTVVGEQRGGGCLKCHAALFQFSGPGSQATGA